MTTPTESIKFTSAAVGPFTLKGGRYQIGCVATFGGGSVSFEGELPDLSSFAIVKDIGANAVTFSAAGWFTVDLAPGQYKIVITTATAVIVTATTIPY